METGSRGCTSCPSCQGKGRCVIRNRWSGLLRRKRPEAGIGGWPGARAPGWLHPPVLLRADTLRHCRLPPPGLGRSDQTLALPSPQ